MAAVVAWDSDTEEEGEISHVCVSGVCVGVCV